MMTTRLECPNWAPPDVWEAAVRCATGNSRDDTPTVAEVTLIAATILSERLRAALAVRSVVKHFAGSTIDYLLDELTDAILKGGQPDDRPSQR